MSLLARFLARKPAPEGAPDRETLDAWLRRAYDDQTTGKLHEAQALYRKILDHDPHDADALFFLGVVAVNDGRETEAIDLFEKAVAARPNDAALRYALGGTYFNLGRFDESARSFRAGTALQPNNVHMQANLWAAMVEAGYDEDARIAMERARAAGMDTPQINANLGSIYRNHGRIEESIAAYRKALEVVHHNPVEYSNMLLTMNCSVRYDAAALFAEHQKFSERFARPYIAPPPDTSWPRKLRIGYVSPDFRAHVVAFFFEPILAHHERTQFEVFCYYNHRHDDRFTARLRGLADHWIDCVHLSDAEMADRIRADRIDVLVDLAGHTGHNRLPVFAMKPAPVQATYLGYPNTSGLAAIDYRITDARADPPGAADRLNAERLAYLPDCFHCYRPREDSPDVGPLPANQAGIITFGCFNNSSKYSEAFAHAAARVLAAVPGSRLWLKSKALSIPYVAEDLRERFRRAGIDPSRLEISGWKPTFGDNLAAYGSVDIALDTIPYNGTTTTCEALWMGVPVVTIAGDRHAARVGVSLLHAVGLEELVATDVEEYVAICAALAADRERLSGLRKGLRERMRRSPLTDEVGFTRALERCYLEMWQAKVRDSTAATTLEERALGGLLEQAVAQRNAGKLREAAEAYKEVLLRRPDHREALTAMWDLSFEGGNPGAAVDWLNRAISARGDVAAFHYMLGCSLQAQGKIEDAIGSFSSALEIDPSFAKAQNNLGSAFELLGRIEAAAQCYHRAVELDAKLAVSYYNLGNAYWQLGDPVKSIEYLREALALEPDHAHWHCMLADALYDQRRLDEAVASYRKAMEIDPRFPPAHSGLGLALAALGRPADAETAFRRAVELEPDFSEAHSQLLVMLHYEQAEARQALFDEHVTWASRHARTLCWQAARSDEERRRQGRLKIGYVSPDFKRHPVASFIEPVLGAHDRSRIHVFCYSNVPHPDQVTQGMQGLCEEWRDISRLTDEQVADRIRADRIDILVDLAGHHAGGRLGLFARKPAPVQVTWLGYPSTTALRAIDYRFTDEYADPRGESERFHTEKLVRLPDGFLCYSPPAGSPEPGEVPSLVRGHVTFGSFSELAKLTPAMIALWSRILHALPDARLLVQADALSAQSARQELLARFAGHGVEAMRLRIVGPDAASHLARYNEVDVALDMYPYNGVSTTCEALWMGVPVVTLAGTAHASRVGASILNRVGLEDLVAMNPEAYFATALRLASDAGRRCELRRSLRERLHGSPLLDAARFTRGLEAAYLDMWARYVDPGGEPMRLHIGGMQKMPGWKILNVQSAPEVDYVGDCTDLSQFPDGSVDEIYASHVLEHLGYIERLPHALAEFHRVLKEGGSAKISVPDFEVLCRLFLDPRHGTSERFHVMRMAFGGQVDPHDFHHVGLSFEILAEFLRAAGFTKVERTGEFGLFDDTSSLRFAGTPISLNVIACR